MQTEFRTVREQPTAVLRATLRGGEIRDWFDVAFPRVAGYLYRHGLVACGFPFSRDHLYPDGTYLVEAGFPVPVEIEGDGDVQPSSLPGGQVVVARHVGSYDDVAYAYRAVDDWLKAEQAVRVGDTWEVYHGAGGDRAGYCTEVIQPFGLVPVLSTSES